MRTLILLLLLCSPVYSQAVYKGNIYNSRVCNNPNCRMCAAIERQLVAQTTPTPTQEGYWVSEQVKRCDGTRCWFETVRRFVTAPAKVVKKTVDLLRVTDLEPTPYDAVTAFVKVAAPKSTDVLYDLGCGDGRILIAATTAYGCRTVGIELNEETAEVAERSVRLFKLQNRIKVYRGDILKFNYPEATIVTVYLYPELITKIIPLLPSGCKLISYIHEIPNGTKHEVDGHVFYEWTKP